MTAFRDTLRFGACLNAHPAWWQVAGMPPALLQALQGGTSAKVRGRLAGEVARRMHVGSQPEQGQLTPIDLALDPSKFDEIVRFAGAVWHANRLKWVIETQERQRLIDHIGHDAFSFALQHARLSATFGEIGEIEAMTRSIRDDGYRCWQAWLVTRPRAVRSRLVLATPPAMPVADFWTKAQKRKAVTIVETVLAKLMSHSKGPA